MFKRGLHQSSSQPVNELRDISTCLQTKVFHPAQGLSYLFWNTISCGTPVVYLKLIEFFFLRKPFFDNVYSIFIYLRLISKRVSRCILFLEATTFHGRIFQTHKRERYLLVYSDLRRYAIFCAFVCD